MKKVLFATTALALSAGWTTVAAAQDTGVSISLSGSAAMGVIGGSRFKGQIEEIDGVPILDPITGLPTGDADDLLVDIDETDISFATDIDVRFTMIGQTDTGLEFGAEIDLDEATDADAPFGSQDFEEPREQRGETLFISGAFGRLTMGDTDGALDWALSEAIIGGTIGDVTEHVGFLGTSGIDTDGDGVLESTVAVVDGNKGLDGLYDGQIARYEYAFANFAVAFSGEIEDSGDDDDPVLGVGVRYDANFAGAEIGFGLGAQTISGLDDLAEDLVDAVDPDEEVSDNITVIGVSADAAFAGGFRGIINYSDYDDLGDHWGLALGYETGPLLVSANWGQFNADPDFMGDSQGWGLTANYDLGGGAQLQAGYSRNDVDGLDEEDLYSFGLAMSF